MNLNIFEMSRLLSKQKVLSLGLFNDNKTKSKSKYLIFFEKIVDHSINSDDEAIRFLGYKNKASYNKFKRRFTNKVINYLSLLDTRESTKDTSKESYHNLMRLYTVARYLHFRGQKKNAITIYQHIYNESQKSGLIELSLISIIPLKSHFAFVDPDRKKFNMYSEQLKECEKKLSRYLKVIEHYDEISYKNIVSSNSNIKQFKEETLAIGKSLLDDIREDDVFIHKNQVYDIASFAYNLNSEYEKSIEISKQSVEASFEHYDGLNNEVLLAYKDILSSYIKLKDFENAKIYLEKIVSSKSTVGHNYFRNKGLEFALYAATKEYDKLYSLCHEILKIRKLKDFKVHKEEWNIRAAFVNILVESGKIDAELIENAGKHKFKLNKFINEVEFYSKDKRGINISIHIVQLIHFLIRKEYGKIHDRLDALNQYTFRYLRNDETLRSNCFIKMLLKLPEAEYNPIRTKRYVAKYEKKLLENPFAVSLKELAVEIIPYEDLWSIIINILDDNLNKKNKK